MELKASALGKHLAQHPYDRIEILTAGVRVSGDRHEYLIPFNQLLAIHCKRGLVWGEMEFVLADNQVVRLHGTPWQETQHFWQHLSGLWAGWSQQMSEVAARVLQEQLMHIQQRSQSSHWISYRDVSDLSEQMHKAFSALPLPVARLAEFEHCRISWQQCNYWIEQAQVWRFEHNQAWTESMQQQYVEFFDSIAPTPLNPSQVRAVVNGEDSVLVLGRAGSGKTACLVVRAGWLVRYRQAAAEQILLLTCSQAAVQQMDHVISQALHTAEISGRTFQTLALFIIQQASNKTPKFSQFEQDEQARYALLTECWQQQCASKKAFANGWRKWLQTVLARPLKQDHFWQEPELIHWLMPRLDQQLSLLRMQEGGQKHLLERVTPELREPFAKHLALVMPLHKAWKAALKAEEATEFVSLMQQAVHLVQTGRFISPWKYILLDEFEDLNASHMALLTAFRQQNPRTMLFAVGDDWQAVNRFTAGEINLVDDFNRNFGTGDICILDTSYRFGTRIGDIASQWMRQNPYQQAKPLNCLTAGDKKALILLPAEQLAALLDKLSGFVRPEQRILLLARYYHLRPSLLDVAATRWPALHLEFMTIHAGKGQQADYCIIIGLENMTDDLPADNTASVMEQALSAPAESFPHAKERRLLYVALTRASQRVWLLYNKQCPSPLVNELKQLGVPVARKP